MRACRQVQAGGPPIAIRRVPHSLRPRWRIGRMRGSCGGGLLFHPDRPGDLDGSPEAVRRRALCNVGGQRALHLLAGGAGGQPQGVVNMNPGERDDPVHDLVHALGPRPNRVVGQRNPAHLQCASESSEQSAGGCRDDIIDWKRPIRFVIQPEVGFDGTMNPEVECGAVGQGGAAVNTVHSDDICAGCVKGIAHAGANAPVGVKRLPTGAETGRDFGGRIGPGRSYGGRWSEATPTSRRRQTGLAPGAAIRLLRTQGRTPSERRCSGVESSPPSRESSRKNTSPPRRFTMPSPWHRPLRGPARSAPQETAGARAPIAPWRSPAPVAPCAGQD